MDDQSKLEADFMREMLKVYDNALAQCGYRATRFRQMVLEHRGVGAAKALLVGDHIASGLVELWQCGRLGITMEALVLQPQWQSLFTAEELEVARDRLERLGYLQGSTDPSSGSSV